LLVMGVDRLTTARLRRYSDKSILAVGVTVEAGLLPACAELGC